MATFSRNAERVLRILDWRTTLDDRDGLPAGTTRTFRLVIDESAQYRGRDGTLRYRLTIQEEIGVDQWQVILTTETPRAPADWVNADAAVYLREAVEAYCDLSGIVFS